MLTLPDGGDEKERYDGVPLVIFPETVTAEAMETFLTFFYEPINSHLAQEDIDIPYKLFDVLVLADMLMVDKLKTAIIDRIRQDWAIPSVQVWIQKFSRLNPNKGLRPRFHEPASAIRVGRKFDTTLITPLQFFELSFRDPFLDYQPASPSSESSIDSPSLSDDRANSGARWDLVSHEDKQRAGHGRHLFLSALRLKFSNIVSPMTFGPSSNNFSSSPCYVRDDDGRCQSALKERGEAFLKDMLCGSHPLWVLSQGKWGKGRGYTFSWGYSANVLHDQCAESWDWAAEEVLFELFEKIPEYYAIL